MAIDGELQACQAERVESHLEECWSCRTRRQEIESAIGEFIRVQRDSLGERVSPPDGPRALLKAQLQRLAESDRASRPRGQGSIARHLGWAAVAAALLAGSGAIVFHLLSPRYSTRMMTVTLPNPRFTPGATVLVDRRELCRETSVKNKAVPSALQRTVFAEYGIGSVAPGAYELDYLITPALGGADDIHNVWPQSSEGTVWNSRVKDDLEDHLRDLVCDGRLDLATAQRDIAGNWIEAYKKYFRTDQPFRNSQ